MNATPVLDQLASVHRGRRWIIATDIAAGTTELVDKLDEWGAAGSMVIAAQEGIGELPDVPTHYTRTGGGATGMHAIRAFEAAIGSPSQELLAAVDRFDPSGEATVIANHFSLLKEAAGRCTYGPRPPAQAALEDKTIVDELWDEAGIARAPSLIVPVAEAARASRHVETPMGTVWVADNKEGFHGGNNYVRWVRTAEDRRDATAWFAEHADRVRVMPFLDGIPCSIHGWITRNGIAVFRPLEMLVLRRTDRTGFVYGGYANYWDPPWRHRVAMRHIARAVGVRLIARVGYIGAYGIDGVLTADGFLPTELNPRLTAGHIGPAEAAGLPAGSMVRAQLAGDLELDAAWLESTLLTAGDVTRSGRAVATQPGALSDKEMSVRFENGFAHAAGPTDAAAVLKTGVSPYGGIVMVNFDPEATPKGPSVAPRAVAALALARTTWDLDLPPVEPAPDLFARPS